MSMRSDFNGSLSPGNGKKVIPKLVRFDTAPSVKDGQCLFGEIKMNPSRSITDEGVGDETIVSKSQRNSDEHTKVTTP